MQYRENLVYQNPDPRLRIIRFASQIYDPVATFGAAIVAALGAMQLFHHVTVIIVVVVIIIVVIIIIFIDIIFIVVATAAAAVTT